MRTFPELLCHGVSLACLNYQQENYHRYIMPMITLGQDKPYLIILEDSCSTQIVLKNEVRKRPSIIRRSKAPGIFFSLGKISGRSQFIWFNVCEKVISSLQLVWIQIFFLIYKILSVTQSLNCCLADKWLVFGDHSICPSHAYFGRDPTPYIRF